jgi:hypothetical protein
MPDAFGKSDHRSDFSRVGNGASYPGDALEGEARGGRASGAEVALAAEGRVADLIPGVGTRERAPFQ